MKKLLATLVVIAMVLSLAPMVMASAAKVEFTDFMYLDEGENEIPEVEEGLVYTQVTANLNGTSPNPVTLVVMVCDKETGKIKSVGSDSATLSGALTSATLKAGATVNDLDTEEYKYFIWDSELNHTPLDNCEPAKPGNLYDSNNKPSAIELSWDAAYDDFDDVAYYNVYSDGILVAEAIDETTFTEKYLDKDSMHHYEVEAVDGSGLVSSVSELDVKSANVMNIKMTTDDPTNTTEIEEDGLWLWINQARPDKTGPTAAQGQTLGWTEVSEAGGRVCRAAVTAPNRGDKMSGRFTAKVDPERISADDKDLIIEFTYFDDDTQDINLTYTRNDSTSATTKTSTVSLKKTGTNMWKVASVRVSNANFHYYMDNGTGQGNFRFWQGTSGLHVSDIAVAKRSDYDGDPAGLRVKDVPEIRDVIFYMDKAEAVEVDGVNCVEIDGSESLDFDITDTRLNGVGRVNVEIEYLDEGVGDVAIEYMTAAGSKVKTVELTNSGEWKKAVVEISDAKFAIGSKLPVSTDDLIVSSTSGENFRVKSIRVYDAR